MWGWHAGDGGPDLRDRKGGILEADLPCLRGERAEPEAASLPGFPRGRSPREARQARRDMARYRGRRTPHHLQPEALETQKRGDLEEASRHPRSVPRQELALNEVNPVPLRGGYVEGVELGQILGRERVRLVGEQDDLGPQSLYFPQRDSGVAGSRAADVLAARYLQHVVDVGVRTDAHVRAFPDRDEDPTWFTAPGL